MRRVLVGFVLLLTACATDTLDAGSDAESTTDAPPDRPLPDWSSVGSCPAGAQLPFVGTWEGYLQDMYFEPILPLRLVVAGASAGGVCGTLTWDTETAPPPPVGTDPDVDYPPGYTWSNEAKFSAIAGFTYTIVHGGAQDRSLRVAIALPEVWKDYCELQTSVFHRGWGWICPPDSKECTTFTTDGDAVVPVGKCACGLGTVCECNSTGCAASTQTITKDFALTLDELPDGQVLTGEADYGYNIHLERVE